MSWLGQAALWCALAAAAAAVAVSIVTTVTGRERGKKVLCWLAWVSFVSVSVASGVLVAALLTDDFRLAYVARHSYRMLAPAYKVAAWWSGQEGSLLFWLWLLSGYTALLAKPRRDEMGHLLAPALGIMAGVQIFFGLLLLLVAHPFQTLATPPADGRGLNPLLQSYWMISHPVLLYLGYVGMTVPFAIAMAALLVERKGNDWIRLTRRWTLSAWLFLSLGIMVGARWAYEELGWGGYWAWDPVENASFMPWLTSTAFMHSVMIQERRGMLKKWNVLLVLLTFFLTIYGTFVTRSGILSSVHTFVESDIGPWFVVFLGIILSGGLYVMVERRHLLRDDKPVESYASREFGFLVNNLIFLGLAFAIFWGTVFPLAARLFGVEVTVAAPYFNRITVPLFVALIFLMGIGPLLAWRQSSWQTIRRNLLLPVGNALLFGLLAWASGIRSWGFLLTLAGAALVVSAVTLELVQAVMARLRFTGDRWWSVVPGLVARNPRRWGGYLVHVAVVIIAVGIAGHQYYHTEQLASFRVGDTLRAGPYQLVFEGLEEGQRDGVPYVAGRMLVREGSQNLGYLLPMKLYYPGFAETQGPRTEVAIHSTLAGDLYVVLAGWDDFGTTVGFQVFWNPMIGWLWWGGLLLLAGTLVCLWPRPQRAALVIDQVYANLQELEYDRAMDKVSWEDYQRLKAELIQQAARLHGEEAAAREALARELAALRAVRAGARPAAGGDNHGG